MFSRHLPYTKHSIKFWVYSFEYDKHNLCSHGAQSYSLSLNPSLYFNFSPISLGLAFWPLSLKHPQVLLFYCPSSHSQGTTQHRSIQLSNSLFPHRGRWGKIYTVVQTGAHLLKRDLQLCWKKFFCFHNQLSFLFIMTSNLYSPQT